MTNFLNYSVSLCGFELLVLLTAAAVKATLLLGAAALLCLFFRRFSAATRHLVWACALCASLLMPFLSLASSWEVPLLPAAVSVLSETDSSAAADTEIVLEKARAPQPSNSKNYSERQVDRPKESQIPSLAGALASTDEASSEKPASIFPQLINWTLIVWLAGALLFLFRLLVGMCSTNLLARRGVEFENPKLNELFAALRAQLKLKSSVRLLRSRCTSMPVVCGILRPAILLPAEAEAWSAERQKMVLLHELTHVARRDCLTQMLAQMAGAFYWFNPFVWFAERRLRIEREQACDDYVLSVGTRPSDYAQHLLDIARTLNECSVFDWSRTSTVAVARKSQLEGRLRAILLQTGERRARRSPLATASIIALIGLLLFSLAFVRPTSIKAQKSRSSSDRSDFQSETAENSPLESFRLFGSAEKTAALTEDSIAEQIIREVEKESPETLLADTQTGDDPQPKANPEDADEPSAVEEAAPADPSLQPAPQIRPENLPSPAPFIAIKFESEPGSERTGDFIDEMASVGYTNLSIDELVRLKQAGVTAEYVKGLRAIGFANLSVKELASLSLHGVTPVYIQSIRSAGYNDLSPKELTSFSIHEVTPEYIRSLRSAGYDNLTPRNLIDFAVHEVSAAYIGSMRAVGFGNLSPRELVTLRVYQVTPDFIRQARSRLGDLTLKQIVALKSRGTLDEDQDKDK